MKSIGERLAYVRSTILEMNQADFAKLLGVSQGALSAMENNKRGLPMEAIIKLMVYSKSNNSVSCSWILTGIEDNPTPNTLSPDEQELLSTYNSLDRRGKHSIHMAIYNELDRMNTTSSVDAKIS
ncbi:MAG: helix-turn-helix domain-containing protein [Clostridiales bacterium]|nr:helix-turn-helix domain-containing protein [Clostridiales bacterium]